MTTEKKVIGGITIISIAILAGGVFFSSQQNSPSSPIPDNNIITKNGLHWHPKLSIYIKGEKKELEDGIGLGAIHLPIHIHTEDYKDGVVHMEMQGVVTKDDTKLGKFFQIWRKDFNKNQIFDKKNGAEGTVAMTVNGKNNTEFENYLMRDKDIIEIRYE